MIKTSRQRRWRHASAAFALAAASALVLAGCSSSPASSTSGSPSGSTAVKSSYKIGVFEVAQADLLDTVVKKFEDALQAGVPNATFTFDLKNANGDQSLISSISRDFAGSGDDAFAVIGTPAVIALAQLVKDKPIFALAMGDPVGAGLAKSLDAPGGNVTGSTDYIDPGLLLAKIKATQPGVKSIGTVYDPSNQNLQVWVKALKAAAGPAGYSIVESTVSGPADVTQAARSLEGRVDAILIGPDATVIAGIDAVGAAATAAKVALYVVGGDVTKSGVLASLGANYPETGTTAGEGAAKVFLGAAPGTVPFAQPQGLDVVFSKKTIAALGLTIPKDVLDSATVQ
ncbi:ABC transporter substrate-binding protein [Gryllotalpicola sp.]|uniref:ABC transporter substrate-binding protein n=1 Tax=Gryllotalpicola sp. TaxID=1932787 RepID=UPI0026207EC5|nr:ABC transporter substrate-binding protein [Gryllotalpicola sp.]